MPSPPYLHDLTLTVAAPWVVLSAPDGQLRTGVQGVYARDRRVLSRLEVTVDGRLPVPLAGAETAAGEAEFSAVLDWLGGGHHDPRITLHRRRRTHSDGLTEEFTITNRSGTTVRSEVVLHLAADLAGTDAVRSGAAEALPPIGLVPAGGGLAWSGDGIEVGASFTPPPESYDGAARWSCVVEPGESWTLRLELAASDGVRSAFRIEPPAERPSYTLVVDCDDLRVTRWVERSLSDLAGLMLADPDAPDDRYLGAGPPWYLTLFGRDSLISASMLQAADPELAAGTLRALARRQGTRIDTDAAEQPGKIAHELRMRTSELNANLVLPPAYYGSHDATQLWLTTLHRAWRWGMPADQVTALLPAVRAALGWLRDHSDPDGDGFAEYFDESGHGLANQGWKDSSDGVQWPDGTLAEAPIALSEVQGYGYAAALAGADLLDSAGDPGAGWWRQWAAELRARFRDAFWVDGYPAIALDLDKRPVTGPASNMGHLLATGILDPAEAEQVAGQLGSAGLDSGFGLRTMSTSAQGFNPLGYHTGTVWPHDTAMAIEGLARTGHGEVARSLLAGLLDAAEAFGYRLPELYGGLGRAVEAVPAPYPRACRPQAWAAAAPIGILTALLGIEPDVPAGTLRVAPVRPFPWRRLEVRGLRVGGGVLSIRVDGDSTEVIESPPGLTVTRGPR